MRKRKGFTLIELLVVISVIALLISIMTPALNRVKEQARSITCSTRIKSLLLAWRLYAVDNNDRLCGPITFLNLSGSTDYGDREWDRTWASWSNAQNSSVDYGDRPWDWTWAPWDAAKNDSVQKSNSTTVSSTKDQKAEGIKRGALFVYADDIDVYHCPSDKGDNFRSYSMPDYLGAPRWSWDWVHNNSRKRLPPDLKLYERYSRMTSIKRPTESIVFLEEEDLRDFNMGSFILSPYRSYWHDSLGIWHDGSSNFGFADGHVEKRTWSKETIDRFADGEVLWAPVTPGGIADLEWMQRGWSK